MYRIQTAGGWLCVMAACFATGAAVSSAVGSTTLTSDMLFTREGTTDYSVTFTVPAGTFIGYANGENCGNSAHKTIGLGGSTSRFFKHWHITYTLPKTGVDQFGAARTVDNNKINAYWDNYYGANYTRKSSADHTSNCWGWALGYNIWIEDPSYIYADDYKTTTDYKASNKDCLAGHVIYILEVWDCGKIKQTWEKNRASGHYERNYATPGSTARGTMREYK
jgi:hypothetical protein